MPRLIKGFCDGGEGYINPFQRFYAMHVVVPPAKPSEALAWDVISRHIGARWLKNADLNVGRAIHDFDIMRGPVPVGAVEVTEDRDESAAGWQAKKIGDFDVRPCQRGWEISTNRYPAKPRVWAKQVLVPFLLSLEAAHASRVTIYPDSPYNPVIPPGLADLGFVAAIAEPAGSPTLKAGSARLIVGSVSMLVGTEPLAAWSTDFLFSQRCQGEREKLAQSRRRERHLAVVIPFMPATDLSIHSYLMAVANYGPPSTLPGLPPEITQLWLISDYPGTPSLRFSGRRWTVLPPVEPFEL